MFDRAQQMAAQYGLYLRARFVFDNDNLFLLLPPPSDELDIGVTIKDGTYTVTSATDDDGVLYWDEYTSLEAAVANALARYKRARWDDRRPTVIDHPDQPPRVDRAPR